MKYLTAAALSLAAILALADASVARAGGGEAKPDAPLSLPLEGETIGPEWRNKPSNDELQREYPQLAFLMKLAGGATVTCVVEVDGRLDDCHVSSEWPAGLGFGAAALRSTAYFSMKPAMRDGKPVVGMVNIPLNFAVGEAVNAPDVAVMPPPTSPAALVEARRVVVLEGLASRLRAQWSPNLAGLAAEVVQSGQVQLGTTVLDAFRQGLDDTIADDADREAAFLASRMTEAQLSVTADYLQTPAGQSWVKALAASSNTPIPISFLNDLAMAARVHLCAKIDCTIAGASSTSKVSRADH